MDFWKDPKVLAGLARAWAASEVESPATRHEEGGFIVRSADASYDVVPWARGGAAGIIPPALDDQNCYNGVSVVAAFHTHPNPPIDETGDEWEQAPSAADRRWHARRNLEGIVISRRLVYRIAASGAVSVLGARDEVLSQ